MHFCGNPLHDAPLYVLLSLPFIMPAWLWIRSLVHRRESLERSRRSARAARIDE